MASQRAFILYRNLIKVILSFGNLCDCFYVKAAKTMHTQNRRDWIYNKVRYEFRESMHEKDPEKIEFLLKI